MPPVPSASDRRPARVEPADSRSVGSSPRVDPGDRKAGEAPGQLDGGRGWSVRGERLIQRLENGVLFLDRLIHEFVPPAFNPLAQTGAIANTCLVAAIISGVALLVWYTPSVHQAHASLEAIRHSSWLGQLVRSLHRYSSDACMLFALLHTARILLARRFTGARWLAWVSGVALLALVWVIGWTGYWLVWDRPAQQIATGTARFVDALPIFAEPLSRSFLTDESVHSLLFFLIFFVHMLLPLAVGIGLWVHLMRVSRPKLCTRRTMTLWVAGSLVVLSVLLPATSAEPAHMTFKAERFTMDWWYLWPLALTDRLGGGLLWALFSFGGLAFATLPWWMTRRWLREEDKARVDLSRCFGCTLCSKDCPFAAITMIPREDGKKFAVQSHVNPALCVGCGICTGACDSAAIQLPWLDSKDVSKRIHAWIERRVGLGEPAFLAFLCAESFFAGRRQGVLEDYDGLPGFLVCAVPCVGWVSAPMIENAWHCGAAGVLIAGCGEGDPASREGANWLRQRLAGKREPALDPTKVDVARIRFLPSDRTRHASLLRAAEDFRNCVNTESITRTRSPMARGLAAAGVAMVLGAATFAVSHLPYRTPWSPGPELVISFNHRGGLSEQQALTKAELAKRLPHMRAQVDVTRHRVPVRLRIYVDNQPVLERSYKPRGLARDGSSIAIERLSVTVGVHDVRVEIGDTVNPATWEHQWHDQVEFKDHCVNVVLFDTKTGFSLH